MTDCPCGQEHEPSENIPLEFYEGRIPVKLIHKPVAYWVPRIYIAFHGLRAVDLEDLAKLYGWREV